MLPCWGTMAGVAWASFPGPGELLENGYRALALCFFVLFAFSLLTTSFVQCRKSTT